MDTIAPTTSVLCPVCNLTSRKFGKDRKGNQRYQCPKCEKTFAVAVNPLGDMRLGMTNAAKCLHLLLEGTSLRAASRLSGFNRETILNLMVQVPTPVSYFPCTSTAKNGSANSPIGPVGRIANTCRPTGRSSGNTNVMVVLVPCGALKSQL